MKIALFARSVHPEDFGLIQKIIKLLDQFNITPVFYKPFLNRLNNELNINAETFDNHNDIDQSYNFIFSIG